MAEADPPEKEHFELHPDSHTDTSRRIIQVLMLGTRWSFDTYGVSTISKSLVNNLRLVDPEAKSINVTCAVLGEKGKVNSDQIKNAAKCKVQLQFAEQPQGKRKEPELSWLNEYITSYYQHLILDTKYDFIIGHMPYLVYGCLNLKQHSMNIHRDHTPKVILMVHDVPRNQEGDIDEEVLTAWLNGTDEIFSIGHVVQKTIQSHIRSQNISTEHKLYLPSYPLELFKLQRDAAVGKPRGEQNILMMAREMEDFGVADVDFELAVVSAAEASKSIMNTEGFKGGLSFKLVVARDDEKQAWKQKLKEVKDKHRLNGISPTFELAGPQDNMKLEAHMKKAAILLLPLKQNSFLFGTEALVAMAAGVPILVSKNSGVAEFLQGLGINEPIVRDNEGFKKDAEEWTKRLIHKITNVDESQNAAETLKQSLLLDSQVAATQLSFIQSIIESSTVQLRVEFETDSVVSDPHRKMASEFGVKLDADPVDIKKYIIAFLLKLLLQNAKLDRSLVRNMKTDVVKLWKEILGALEQHGRKLVDVYSGSIMLTLFCPTMSSELQLQNENWTRNLEQKLQEFFKALSVKARVRILKITPKFKESAFAASEGYETLAGADSEVRSQILGGDEKVLEWLERQQTGLKMTHPEGSHGESSGLKLVETIPLEAMKNDIMNRFSLSESGSIAFASDFFPPLFLLNPKTSKAPTIFPTDQKYYSPVFVRNSKENKEYVAAYCIGERSVHMWDVKSKKPKVAFRLNVDKMNLCAVDQKNIVCGELSPTEETHSMYKLGTNSEPWRLSSSMKIESRSLISDMCYIRVDSTPCVILCCPSDGSVQAVEMVGGRMRWMVRKEEMREDFNPLSVCADSARSTLYVTDPIQNVLHQIDAEAGVVVKSVNLLPFHGFHSPQCVRYQGQEIYIACVNSTTKKHVIAKFTKSEEV